MSLPDLESSCGGFTKLLYLSCIPEIIETAIELEIFEALATLPMPVSNLSKKLDIDEFVTEALLEVLVAIDLLTVHNGAYTITQVTRDFLLKAAPANQAGVVKQFTGRGGPMAGLEDVLRQGAPEFNDRMWGSTEAVLTIEQESRGGMIQAVSGFVNAIPGFENCLKMCDLGGNSGYYSFAFMDKNPRLESHVYDLPEVCAVARDLKRNEKSYRRITYHGFDMKQDDTFGNGYDLFFVSHLLCECNAKGMLPDFLKKVNRAMRPGGIFVSSHAVNASLGDGRTVSSIVELITRTGGYLTHFLPEQDLTAALKSASFSKFITRRMEKEFYFPALLLSAVKTDEIE